MIFPRKNQSLGKSWRKLQAINEGTLLPNKLQKEDLDMVLELLSQVNDKILEEFSLISPTSPSSIKSISHVIFEIINTQGSTPQSYNDFLYQYIDLPREKSFIKSTLQKVQNDNSNKPIAILIGYEHVERVHSELTKANPESHQVFQTKRIDPKTPKAGCQQSLGFW